MKITTLVALSQLSLISLFASGSGTYGVPTWLDQATYTINDYGGRLNGLNRSIADGDRFCNTLKGALNAKYPSISVSRNYNLTDAGVTRAVYMGTTQNSSEMVFFSGHGSEYGISGYDQTVAPGDKAYGGYSRWAFFSACRVLKYHDPEYYGPMFGGAHALFGYESISWEYIHHDCGLFGCGPYYRSEDVWNYMSDKWVNKSMFLYDAYVQAIQETIYNQGGHGVAPAAVYPYGNVSGIWFIGGTEKVTTIFNGDVSWAALNHVYRHEIYGTPEY